MLGDLLGDSYGPIISITAVVLFLAWKFLRYIIQTEAQKLAPKAEPPRVPVLQDLPRTCKTCRHFNKRVWEGAMNKLPVFVEASRWLSPNTMGSTVQRDEEGSPIEGVEDHQGPLSAAQDDWALFAVCTNSLSPNHLVGLHQDDSCELWEAPDVA